MSKKVRAAVIALMVKRGKAWLRANPGKVVQVRIVPMMGHHGLMCLPLNFAVSERFVHCNADGEKFIKALDPDDELSATVAMFLEMREILAKVLP